MVRKMLFSAVLMDTEALYEDCPIGDVYRHWRRLGNLPQFMAHLDRVTETSDSMTRHAR